MAAVEEVGRRMTGLRFCKFKGRRYFHNRLKPFSLDSHDIYAEDIKKRHHTTKPYSKFWEPVNEDCLNFIAHLPPVASYVYQSTWFDFTPTWFVPVIVNVEMSVLIVHPVGSALGGPYLSFVAAFNGFAGPLHGMSNQNEYLSKVCLPLFVCITLFFGVLRTIGVGSQPIWERALGLPLKRPKCVSFEWLENYSKRPA
uniref:Transmembrane protein n=1 Tax=Oryza punctata TaxID=4537 RepID=A0A0E0LDJ0_ORYPU